MLKLIVAACLYVSSSLCGLLPNPEFEVADTTYLRLTDGSYAGVKPRIRARQYFCASQEAVLWSYRARAAHIVLTSHPPDCRLNAAAPTALDEMNKFAWLAEGKHVFDGESFTVATTFGDFHVRKFQRGDWFCFFFYNGLKEAPPPAKDGVVRRVVGYACGDPRVTKTQAEIRRFVEGIAVADAPGSGIARQSSSPVFRTPSMRSHVERAYELSGRWEGVSDSLSGRFEYSAHAPTGAFELDRVGEKSVCYGQWRRGTGGRSAMRWAEWEIACKGVPAARGNFYLLGRHTGEMTGLDEQGRLIKLRFGDPSTAAGSKPDKEQRLSVDWEGVVSARPVDLTYTTAGRGGGLSFRDKGGAIDCEGVWFFNGDWTAQCSNGRTVAGNSFRFQHGTILGTGTDDLGRHFRFGDS